MYKLSSVALIALCLLNGCGEKTATAPVASTTAPEVTVVTVKNENVPRVIELSGRTTPYLIAEVRPQVNGIILKRPFNEGGDVKAGQLLYQIDPSVYQTTYDSAKANLALAEASVYSERLKAERYAELAKIQAVSQQSSVDADASLKQAEAQVAVEKAALAKAKIDLNYTKVTSPISGRIGRSSVTPGALVTENQTNVLATVQQLDPIYVDVAQSSAELMSIRKGLEKDKLEGNKVQAVPVKLVLEDGSEYKQTGKLAFAEVTVDESTGSVNLRAVFPNPNGELLPGMYVRAKLTLDKQRESILVPHAAISRNAKGEASVMVVNTENKAEEKIVKAAQSLGDQWVVTEGLVAGERVIVGGQNTVQAGMPVNAQAATLENTTKNTATAVAK